VVTISGRSVPATYDAAIKSGWQIVGGIHEFALDLPAGERFQDDCTKIQAGALCDAFLRSDGRIQASYCDGNGLCSRTLRSPG